MNPNKGSNQSKKTIIHSLPDKYELKGFGKDLFGREGMKWLENCCQRNLPGSTDLELNTRRILAAEPAY
jgi:hypothetical protein